MSKKGVKRLAVIKELMSPNKSYGAYRKAMHTGQPPFVPYIGVYMSDLVFIEDGNKNELSEGVINFYKRKLLSDVIKEMQQYQQEPYNLRVIPQIRIYLENVNPISDDELYKRSKEVDPKGTNR